MRLLLASILCFTWCGCVQPPSPATKPAAQDDAGLYLILAVPSDGLVIDGRLDEPAWKQARAMTDFSAPWSPVPPQKTEFRAFTDKQTLYFAFVVADDNLVLAQPYRGELTLDQEDRVELYFANDDKLARYWCLEIDAAGRVHDFAAKFDRDFDHTWDCPGLKVAATRGQNGYTVEGSMPLASLAAMGLGPIRPGTTIVGGLFRADFKPSQQRPGHIEETWITWIDPKTARATFHVPAAYGRFRFGG